MKVIQSNNMLKLNQKIWSDEKHRDKISKLASKTNKALNKFGIGRGSYKEYKNTNIMMGSSWERNFAEELDKRNIKWKYESKNILNGE